MSERYDEIQEKREEALLAQRKICVHEKLKLCIGSKTNWQIAYCCCGARGNIVPIQDGCYYLRRHRRLLYQKPRSVRLEL